MSELTQRRKARNRIKTKLPVYPARLGDGNGNVVIEGNWCWARVNGQIQRVYNDVVPPRDGIQVRVGYSQDDNARTPRFQVLGSGGNAPAGAANVSITQSLTSQNLEWGKTDDPLNVHLRALTYHRITPVGGMSIYVFGGLYKYGNAVKYIASETINLAAYNTAASGKALFVLIYVKSDGTHAVLKGSEYTASETDPDTILSYIPARPAEAAYVCGAVRLYYGQTAIRELWNLTDITDWRTSPDLDTAYLNYLDFNTAVSPEPAAQAGRMWWNADEDTLNFGMSDGVVLQLGQETFFDVINQSGATIPEGAPVMFAGTLGASGKTLIQLAIADGSLSPEYTMGIVTNSGGIANGGEGKVTWFGKVRHIDTTGAPYGETWADGDLIYISPDTAGYLTKVRPQAPDRAILVAAVIHAAENGTLLVRPTWNAKLTDLDDVDGASPIAKDLLQYDGTVWSPIPVSTLAADIEDAGIFVPFSVLEDTKDPTGWLDPTAITVTYNSTNRTITLTGDLTYYWRGIKRTLTSPWTSSAHNSADGNYFLYSSDGTTFAWSTTPWSFDMLMVAKASKSTSPAYQYAIRETHGLMPWQVHQELHEQISSYRESGGSLTAGTYAENTATDAATTPGFDAAVINDEDNQTTIPAWLEGTYTTLRIGASNKATFDTTSSFPFRFAVGGFIYYNTPSTGAETQAATGRYLNVYQVMIPATTDADSQKYRMVMLQPQAQYTSLAAAQAEDPRGLLFGDLATTTPEFVLYARITYVTSAGDANTGKVRIATGGITYLAGSRMSQVSVGGFAPPNAENVPFTPYGNIAATNVQLAIQELDDEKAPLASPAFTGNPTAPTPSVSDNDTSIATTAFVQSAAVSLAPGSSTRNIIQPSGDYIPLSIKGAVGQAQNLLTVENSSGTDYVAIKSNGSVFVQPTNFVNTGGIGLEVVVVHSGVTATSGASVYGVSGVALANANSGFNLTGPHYGLFYTGIANIVDAGLTLTSSGAMLLRSYASLNVAGTVTNMYGVNMDLWGFNAAATGVISNLYGINLASPTGSSSTGTITNVYGIYLNNISVGATRNYAIYTNTGLVRFGDQVSIIGSADRIQSRNLGNATQTAAIATDETSTGVVINQRSVTAGVENVINEQGADIDTRIEGDTNANLFFIDASADFIGIGKNNPGYRLDVTGEINATAGYRINGTPGASGSFTTVDGKTVTVTNGLITLIV